MLDRRNPQPRRSHTDRRVTDRRETRWPTPERFVRFVRASHSHQVLNGTLLDASVTGIRMVVQERIERREKVLVEIAYSDGDYINLTAEVMWVEPMDEQYLVGCELRVEMADRQAKELQGIAGTVLQ